MLKERYSIILTVYNAEKYLRQCLESIEKQTYRNWELILVNDGSSDESGEIAKEFSKRISLKNDGRSVVYLEHDNRGAVFSRERGICAATGSYLLFIDADDWWDNDLINSVDEIIRETGADIIQYGYKFRNEAGNRTEEIGLAQKGGNGKNRNIVEYDSNVFTYKALTTCYSLWSRAIKKELFDKEEGFYKDYYDVDMTNDLLAFARPLSLAKSYCFSDIYPYNYRILSTSLCHNTSIHKIGSYGRTIAWAEKNLRERNGMTIEHKEFFTSRIGTVLFNEYRGLIFSEKAKDIQYVYKMFGTIFDFDTYIRLNYEKSSDWYERAFFKSFMNRWIVLPRILWAYTVMKDRKSN